MLRLLLPPNLAAAAARNAIAVKAELDTSAPPSRELVPALALLQRWCGGGRPPFFLQLSRAQLRELIALLHGQQVFGVANKAGMFFAWDGGRLVGISDHLSEPAPKPDTLAAAKPSPAKSAPPTSATSMTVDGSEHFLAVTLPSREHSCYAAVLELVKNHGFSLEPSNRKWWLRDRHKTLNFLAAHGARLRNEFRAQFTPGFEKSTAHLQAAAIASEVTETPEGFTLTLGLQAGQTSEAELRAALAGNYGYVESAGQIYLLDPASMNQLAVAQRALAGDPTSAASPRQTWRVSAARVAETQDILDQLSPNFQPPAAWRERSEALRNLASLPPAPIPPGLTAQLRPYQRLGAAWLWHLHRHQLGGILADEMGLGKTLQALALLSAIKSESSGHNRACLVVCPASLLENWRREAARFTPGLRVSVHHGGRRSGDGDFSAHDLVITSYGTLARDRALFETVEFACIVADEAQHVKNRRSQNAQALRALRARGRFMLTGTPLENSLDDLRALFEFLLPGFLDRLPAGLRTEERTWHDARLRARTAPYLLRRTKKSVAPELPPKLEQTIWCEPTAAQAKLYRDVQQRTEREMTDLAAGGANEAQLRFALLTQLLRLRQICCDPRLVAPDSAAGHSAKLEALRELLAEALDDGHRVLIFSQFTSLLALLRAEFDAQEIACCYLDGSMTTRARQAEVDRFQNSPDVPVFLLSLKAGGTGLNLTAADTVVHFDPWWNPAVEAQATDRAHRIGQTRQVTTYKLVCSGTVEEKVLALQQEKRALLADVFEASDAAAAKLSIDDLKSLVGDLRTSNTQHSTANIEV
jgi:superfamily II DNA or RNA helicase